MSEREKIVAWLREQALAFRQQALNYGLRGIFSVAASYQQQEQQCSATADAIERGEHLCGGRLKEEMGSEHIIAWLRKAPDDWPWTGNDIANMIEAGMPPWDPKECAQWHRDEGEEG